jgi:DNA polymerase-1
VYTDLASLEYRLIAHATADPKLLRIFRNGEDIHDNAFHDVYGEWPPNKTERKKGKTLNFGGVYGCGYNRFLEISGLEDGPIARAIFKKMQNLYPIVASWKKGMVCKLHETGQIRNLFGRVRQFQFPITNDDEREAFNWIIQSSGHDILKIYLMEVADRVAKVCKRSVLVSEVHDSMTFDCPEDEYPIVLSIMEELGGDLNPLILEVFGVNMRVPMFAEMEVLEKWA